MSIPLHIHEIPVRTKADAPSGRQAIGLFVVLATALFAWASALPVIDPSRMTDLGLVSVLPPPFYLSLALIAAGFAWQVCYGRAAGPWPFLYLAALVVVLHATPPLVYGTLRYSWAWKHLGIVDYIQRHGTVDRTISFLAAYHNWPGFFAVTTWLADRFGIRAADLAPIVQFTPLVLTLALVAAVLRLMQRLTDDPRLVLTAGWMFVVANWVGQDYFSPQGVTFLGYLILLGLFLGPLRKTEPPWAVLRPRFLAARYPTATPPAGPLPTRIGRPLRALAAAVAMTLILTIVVTHQLTPLLLILATATLAALGWLAPSYLVFVLIAEVIWLLWGAAPFVFEQVRNELAAIGTLSEATTKLANVAAVSADRAWVVLVGRALSAAIVLVGLFGGLRRLLAGFWDLTALALLLVPMPLLLVAYGGESVFRVYLFSSPFLALFAAAAFFPSPQRGKSAFVFPLLATLCLLSATGFLFANNGKDREYRFTPDEIAVARWLYATAPKGTLLIEGARSYPSQFMNYENFSYLPISEENAATQDAIIADPAAVLSRWMSDPRWNDAYVILTSSQKAYLEAGGYMRPGDFAKIEDALLASPHFRIVRASDNAKVFRLLPDVTPSSGFGGGPR